MPSAKQAMKPKFSGILSGLGSELSGKRTKEDGVKSKKRGALFLLGCIIVIIGLSTVYGYFLSTLGIKQVQHMNMTSGWVGHSTSLPGWAQHVTPTPIRLITWRRPNKILCSFSSGRRTARFMTCSAGARTPAKLSGYVVTHMPHNAHTRTLSTTATRRRRAHGQAPVLSMYKDYYSQPSSRKKSVPGYKPPECIEHEAIFGHCMREVLQEAAYTDTVCTRRIGCRVWWLCGQGVAVRVEVWVSIPITCPAVVFVQPACTCASGGATGRTPRSVG